jgi:hypothetical protein
MVDLCKSINEALYRQTTVMSSTTGGCSKQK